MDGIVEDYDLNPDDHPKMMDVMQQSVGEAIIDTILQVLDDNAHDPGQNERLQVRTGHEPHLTVREALADSGHAAASQPPVPSGYELPVSSVWASAVTTMSG
ncbi:hypothetical protein [Nonomuraea sp. NPDC050202]|uniref:hypothetical protein n=1 Tax=Nonomuraea sp. NPDC050202 TaxID=3155035 RepID=UPI0033F1F702